jgi:polysaccharide pyruvyl transferase WcaK-like protein
MGNDMLRVLIPEPIPSLNKGEAAILRGIQAALQFHGDVQITLYSPRSWLEIDQQRYGDEVKVVDGLDLYDVEGAFTEGRRCGICFYLVWAKLALFALLVRFFGANARKITKDPLLQEMVMADVFIVGHDGLLGPDLFWVTLAGRIMGKPVVIYGAGCDGKGRSPSYKVRVFLRYLVRKTLLFTVRDTNTRSYLVDNGCDPDRIYVFPDPAVLMQPCGEGRVKEILRQEDVPHNRPLYGLIPVRGGIVFDESFIDEPDRSKKHELRKKLWLEMINHLLANTDAHLVFIPHCIGPTPGFDDSRMIKDLMASMPDTKGRVSVIEGEYSETEYKGIMAYCQFVLGERTHGLIGSFSVGTPLIALTGENDHRMHYIVDKMFQCTAFNLNRPDVSKLKETLVREWQQRSESRERMKPNVELVRQQAITAALLLKDRLGSLK